MEKKKVLNFQK